MSVSIKQGFYCALAALLVALAPSRAHADSAGLGLNPGRAEVEVMPGEEKTVSFRIDSPPSEQPVRGHLLLSLTDWKINQDTSVTYVDPGSLPDSAAKWVVFSPSSLSIDSGQSQLVRVTVRVPEGTTKGVYRAGVFVQERPPAAPPKPGEHVMMFRFRYLFSLYVMVGQLSGEGHLADLRSIPEHDGVRIICEMNNTGTRHVRPYIDATLRDSHGNTVAALKRYEATVLLPSATNEEPITINDLAPGHYEIEAQIDFQDGHPIQAIKRGIEVPIS